MWQQRGGGAESALLMPAASFLFVLTHITYVFNINLQFGFAITLNIQSCRI